MFYINFKLILTLLQLDLIFRLLKQWKLIFNISVNRSGKKTVSCKKIQSMNR